MPRGILDFSENMSVIIPLYDFSKCDARRKVEELFAAQQLSRELVDECETLAVWALFTKPCDRVFHCRWSDHAAHDGSKDLQVGNALEENFETARPISELAVRVRHEFWVGFNAAARKDQQAASALQMTDRFADNLHPSQRVRFGRSKDKSFFGVGHVQEELNIANDEFEIMAGGMCRDRNGVYRAGVVGGDNKRSAGGDVFDSPRLVRFYKPRQEPTRPSGVPSLGNDAIQVHADFCRGAGGFAENELCEAARARCVWQREDFGQFDEHALIE